MKFLTNLLLLSVLSFSNLYAQKGPGFGISESFTKNWRFLEKEAKDGASPTLNDEKWRILNLPHDWSIEHPCSPDKASSTGYLPGGIGWYRKSFILPDSMEGKRVYIYFEGVYNHSEVYINGEKIGFRPNGYLSFLYDLTPYLHYKGSNIVAVRVNHSEDADSRWYTGSGIYRDVYLVYAPQVHIAQWGVSYQIKGLTDKKATIKIETSLENHHLISEKIQVQQAILDANGRIVASQQNNIISSVGITSQQQTLALSHPKLWSLDSPYLYSLRTRVYNHGKLLDETIQPLGLRTIQFDANKGFSLNGRALKLKGVCIHHDAGILGSAVPKEVWRDRLLKLKSLGINALRLSHNPQAPDLYDLCDEIGLMIKDEAFDEWEFPKKKWVEGWNQGTPSHQGSASYFNEWCQRDIADMIRRDRNHPSIILWSIGNEVDYPNDPYSHPILDSVGIGQQHEKGYHPNLPDANRMGQIAKRLIAAVKQWDTSRPVTGALAGPIMSNKTEYPGLLDVVGYNYTESRYAQDHQQYPSRILYGSETGHSMDAWKAVRDNNYISGQFLWTGLDYLGEAGSWPSRGFTTGLIDLAGNIKPNGYFRQALWSDKPMAYLGAYRIPKSNSRRNSMLSQYASPLWLFEEGELVRVVCYTNCDEVELYLNGKIVGNRIPRNDDKGIVFWDIPYAAGTLSIKGYNKGENVAEQTLYTPERPAALRISKVAQPENKEKEDGITQIWVEIIDKEGHLVANADETITCQLEGPARFIAFENSKPDDMSNSRKPYKQAYGGKLLTYIQRTGKGDIKATFTAPWLTKTEVNF